MTDLAEAFARYAGDLDDTDAGEPAGPINYDEPAPAWPHPEGEEALVAPVADRTARVSDPDERAADERDARIRAESKALADEEQRFRLQAAREAGLLDPRPRQPEHLRVDAVLTEDDRATLAELPAPDRIGEADVTWLRGLRTQVRSLMRDGRERDSQLNRLDRLLSADDARREGVRDARLTELREAKRRKAWADEPGREAGRVIAAAEADARAQSQRIAQDLNEELVAIGPHWDKVGRRERARRRAADAQAEVNASLAKFKAEANRLSAIATQNRRSRPGSAA